MTFTISIKKFTILNHGSTLLGQTFQFPPTSVQEQSVNRAPLGPLSRLSFSSVLPAHSNNWINSVWENYGGVKILFKALSVRSHQIILQSVPENQRL